MKRKFLIIAILTMISGGIISSQHLFGQGGGPVQSVCLGIADGIDEGYISDPTNSKPCFHLKEGTWTQIGISIPCISSEEFPTHKCMEVFCNIENEVCTDDPDVVTPPL